MRQYLKELFLAAAGGLLYIILELVWRGHSHWTMFALGGLCFALIGYFYGKPSGFVVYLHVAF